MAESLKQKLFRQGKRFALDKLRLDEISLVDVPANAGAKVSIYKRGAGMADEMTDAEKRRMQDYMDKGMDEGAARDRVMREMRKDAGASGETANQEGDNMDPKELAEKLEAAEKAAADKDAMIADLTKRLEAVEKSGDEPEYVEFNGAKVEKSAVPAPVLKALEDQAEAIAKMKAEAEAETLRKRADADLPHLTGTADVRGAMLKAAEGIGDEAVSMLKAADAAMKSGFSEVGKSAADDASSATARLNKMASDKAAADGVTFEQGYAEVIKTAEGRKLMAETYREAN